MIKTVIWGFHHANFPQIIETLVAEGCLEPVAWFGKYQGCSHDTRDIFALRTEHLGPLQGYDASIYEQVYQKLSMVMEVTTRETAAYGLSFEELLHLFNCYFDFFFHLLNEKQPDLLLYVHVPHGIELVLYEIAAAMDIPCLMFHQSLAPNRFFYTYSIEDMSHFSMASEHDHGQHFSVPPTFQKKLFYMPTQYRPPESPWRQTTRLLGKAIKKSLSGQPWQSSVAAIARTYSAQRRYITDLQSNAVKQVDLQAPYVYFPLHLQPELTSSTLATPYNDQLLAIEHLTEWLPDDWYIYVKENPKQNWFHRGPFFFDRLKRIPKTVLVHPAVNTYPLMQNSKFVATITGTAGWEAISGGQKVVVFGRPWYLTLPGVFQFRPEMPLIEVLHFRVEHDELEKAYNTLMRKSRRGIVQTAYRALVSDYSEEQNRQHITEFLRRELERFQTMPNPITDNRKTEFPQPLA